MFERILISLVDTFQPSLPSPILRSNYPTNPGLSMVFDTVEVVPSVQRGGVAELPEGLPQIVGAVVFQGTGLLLLKQLVFALHL